MNHIFPNLQDSKLKIQNPISPHLLAQQLIDCSTQKEIKTNTVKVVYRNTNLEPTFLSIQEFIAELPLKLESIQQELYTYSKKLLLNNMQDIESNTLFKEYFEDKNAGFAAAYTKDSPELSSYLENLKVTPRCIISDSEERQCIFTNQPTNTKILFARAY